LHGLVEVLDFLTETMEVEIVANVVFIDLNKKFVAFKVAKPRYPAIAAFGVVIVVQIV
jgi:hypothetical protein